ncbi:MAG: single-stranded DNA-binding protein [Bacteroidota bacterium]|nr:single-stranded DNA-binding protein [Bacteroidota bacterium]
MAKSLNKVQLIGNLGADPEMRYTSSGIAVATFRIATSNSWKDQDGNTQERTDWHNIVAWRKLAEICGEWLKKGRRIYIEGKLQTRSYEKDGVKKYITEVVADDMIMLDGGGKGPAEAPADAETASGTADSMPEKNDDLPF